MRKDVAVRLLAELTGWDVATARALVEEFQTLAAYKYDAYEGYGPGLGFLESLLRWIAQFAPEDRGAAVQFAREHIVFISRAELHHLVELVYPSLVRPALIRATAEETGTPEYFIRRITGSPEYAALQRATLILGLSDGARLDLLRRLTPEFRHEQFFPASELPPSRLEDLRGQGGARLVLLVDDFSATGTTLLRFERGEWAGRLWEASQHVARLLSSEALAPGYGVRVVLYIATELAQRRLTALLAEAELGWQVDVVHTIGDEVRVTEERHPAVCSLCKRYGDRARVRYVPDATGLLAFGCGGAALPLVLYHNTPDNSVSLLWQDRPPEAGGRRMVPLFARYERYPVPAADAATVATGRDEPDAAYDGVQAASGGLSPDPPERRAEGRRKDPSPPRLPPAGSAPAPETAGRRP